jgi:hypothetical protein
MEILNREHLLKASPNYLTSLLILKDLVTSIVVDRLDTEGIHQFDFSFFLSF